MKRLTVFLLSLVMVLAGFGYAYAFQSYLGSFNSTYNTTYPGSAAIGGSCILCHTTATNPSARNSYGSAYGNGHSFSAIESLDSDGDGFTNIAEISANPAKYPGNSGSHPPLVCTSFTYSAWGTCQSNNTQTRTVVTRLPAGCTGGTPVLSQACTYVPPVTVCTTFTYSDWAVCQSDSTQTRTVVSGLPAGCTGGTPVLSQACTYVPPINACTTFTYSDWGACQSNNTQTRTVASGLPAGCTGGTPVLNQACTYVPPVGGTTVNVNAANGTGQITVETLTGGTNLTDVTAFSATDPSVNQSGKPSDSDYAFTDGLVSYRVTGVATGGTVQIKITYPSAIPAGSKVYKVDSAGFHEYANATISGNTITLTLTDGGSGDKDGVANGVIDDPVGVASPVSPPPATSDSGGGCSIGARQNRATAFADSAIILMPLFVMAALRRIRRRKQ